MNLPGPSEPSDPAGNNTGWWTRDSALTVVLAAVTVILVGLCWMMIQPFFSPIAWAIALAVIAHPLHGWIDSRVRQPSIAAALSVILIAIILVAPAIFVGNNIVRQATESIRSVQQSIESGKWRQAVHQTPHLQRAVALIEKQGSLDQHLQGAVTDLGLRISRVVTSSAWLIVELLLVFFVLFYLFRDRNRALTVVRSLVPLSNRETDEVFRRVSDTIYATIYGTLVVAAIQGTLGGLMFWWLGLPAPVLWGTIMALLAIIPVLGAFVIWVPAAIYLASIGDWGKAIILTLWGGVFVALIDNLLYPILVGKRLRMHTVPVFFAILGGLAVFGAAGLVLGPVILALTAAILDIWRRRTAHGRAAEDEVAPGTTH